MREQAWLFFSKTDRKKMEKKNNNKINNRHLPSPPPTPSSFFFLAGWTYFAFTTSNIYFILNLKLRTKVERRSSTSTEKCVQSLLLPLTCHDSPSQPPVSCQRGKRRAVPTFFFFFFVPRNVTDCATPELLRTTPKPNYAPLIRRV